MAHLFDTNKSKHVLPFSGDYGGDEIGVDRTLIFSCFGPCFICQANLHHHLPLMLTMLTTLQHLTRLHYPRVSTRLKLLETTLLLHGVVPILCGCSIL